MYMFQDIKMKASTFVAFSIFLCLFFGQAILNGQEPGQERNSFEQGLKKAKEKNAILVVTLHGSDWNQVGERLLHDVIAKMPESEKVVYADVDWLQTDDPKLKEANLKRNSGWPGGKYSAPAVFVFGPDGIRFGIRKRLELFADSAPAKVVQELIELGIKRRDFVAKIKQAADAGKTQQELKLLAELIALPLDRPQVDLDRVRKLDPQDQFGIVSQLTMPNWFELIAEATREGTNGNGDVLIAKYSKMLKNETYSADQRAMFLLAMGTVYQHSKDQQNKARQALQSAYETAPKSKAGLIAQQRIKKISHKDN